MLKVRDVELQSETALSVFFDEVGDLSLMITLFAERLRSEFDDLVEVIPCQASLFVEFDVLKMGVGDVERVVREGLLKFEVSESEMKDRGVIELPVYYHRDVAPDLVELAREKGLSVEEVIRIHSDGSYGVGSLGFAPGFAYLSGVDSRIAVPRHSSPKMVAKGSVGIADGQTAVYPNESLGGWVIVGRVPGCPVRLFDFDADPVTPFKVGAEVKFVPVTREEFLEMGGEL